MSASLKVPGRPIPKGSMKYVLANRKGGKKFPVTVHNNQEGIARYMSDIRSEWVRSFTTTELSTEPMVLHCIFEFRRPQSHYNAKNELKGASYTTPAPTYMTQSPDGDKLMRSVMDALTGYAYLDDNQVVQGHFVKLWADKDSTSIDVLTMKEADADVGA